jgi:hypothetical protein
MVLRRYVGGSLAFVMENPTATGRTSVESCISSTSVPVSELRFSESDGNLQREDLVEACARCQLNHHLSGQGIRL